MEKVDQGFAKTPDLVGVIKLLEDGEQLASRLLGQTAALVQREPDAIHLEPLERNWLCADGQDELQVVAYLEGELSDEERRSSLEVTVLGPLSLSPPQDGDFYRHWSVRAAGRLTPAVGEVWVRGLVQGRMVQRLISLQLLPPLQITPVPAILVPKHRPRLVLQVRPAEWEVQVSHPTLQVEQTGAGEFQLQLGNETVGLLAPLSITARRKETTLHREIPVLVAQPGPIVLSASPLGLSADCPPELCVSVWRWNETRQDLEVVEEALAHLEFSVASLDFRFLRCQGQGLARQGVYRVTGASRERVMMICAEGLTCNLPLVMS